MFDQIIRNRRILETARYAPLRKELKLIKVKKTPCFSTSKKKFVKSKVEKIRQITKYEKNCQITKTKKMSNHKNEKVSSNHKIQLE